VLKPHRERLLEGPDILERIVVGKDFGFLVCHRIPQWDSAESSRVKVKYVLNFFDIRRIIH
jgi:hypothetical protein